MMKLKSTRNIRKMEFIAFILTRWLVEVELLGISKWIAGSSDFSIAIYDPLQKSVFREEV